MSPSRFAMVALLLGAPACARPAGTPMAEAAKESASLSVPPPPAAMRLYEQSGGGTVMGLAIVTVERHRVRRLLRVPFWAGPQDSESSSPRDGCPEPTASYIWLDAALRGDGLALTITDRPEQRCRDAVREALADVGPVQAKILRKVCGSRGTYTWSGGSFVRSGR